ncbi:MAG: urea ABC transporter permease subunit UrtB [Cyanobacteria bacterium P01_F01_bin.150]
MALFEQVLNVLFNGINTGSVLLIAALGLAIVFGLMGVINLAHGELMMLGAYTTYVVQNSFKAYAEPLLDMYIFIALPLSFIVAALVGLLLERTVVRFLYGRPLETLLATWGVSLILIQFVRSVNTVMLLGILLFSSLFFGGRFILKKFTSWERIQSLATTILVGLSGAIAITFGVLLNRSESDFLTKLWFGPRNIDVTAPKWLRGGFAIEGTTLQFPYARIFIIVLTIICLMAMYWFLNRSAWGLRIRAVTQNRDMSACLGIPTDTVDALTFALGSGLAGVAGCAITLLGSVGPNLGGAYIVDAFMVVVVGGVGNFAGSIIAAIAIGTVSYLVGSGTIPLVLSGMGDSGLIKDTLMAFFNFFAQSSMAKVMVFILIISFLQVRPGGLFPQKGRTVDL